MTISQKTITEILHHRDSTTMFEIVRTLIESLNDRDIRLRSQTEARSRMRALFAKTETDRDRFRRMVEDLVSMSREFGQEERARSIVDAHGGFDEFEAGSENTEILIELD